MYFKIFFIRTNLSEAVSSFIKSTTVIITIRLCCWVEYQQQDNKCLISLDLSMQSACSSSVAEFGIVFFFLCWIYLFCVHVIMKRLQMNAEDFDQYNSQVAFLRSILAFSIFFEWGENFGFIETVDQRLGSQTC